MACDPDALRARIKLLRDEVEELDMEAEEFPGPIAYDNRAKINEKLDKIRALQQELDICLTVPDADDPPFETAFAARSSLILEAFGDPSFHVPGGPTLGFWFSASRRHVRIHEWLRSGRRSGTLYDPPRGRPFWLWTAGRMQRQASGEVIDIQGDKHMRIPIILDVHAEGYPFPASALLTLRTEPPAVTAFWSGDPWWGGQPLHTNEVGEPAIRFVSDGTFSSGFLFGARLVFMLEGTFTSPPVR